MACIAAKSAIASCSTGNGQANPGVVRAGRVDEVVVECATTSLPTIDWQRGTILMEMMLSLLFKGTKCAAIVVALTISGCKKGPPDAILPPRDVKDVDASCISWRPLSVPSNKGSTTFRRLPASETGVNFTVPIDVDHRLKRLYSAGFLCGGVAIGDFNSDGQPDLYLVNGPEQNRLFLQTGKFKFEDHTNNTGGGDAWGASASVVDIDNDGDDDIYVCNYDSPNELFLNQGDATFREAAKEYGLDIVDASFLMTFCDYDRDGDLDGYLLTNKFYRAGGLPADLKLITEKGIVKLPEEHRKYFSLKSTGRNRGELNFIGRPDRLFRNDRDRGFSDVTSIAGIDPRPGHGLSATWWDYDDDGFFDLYIGNDFEDPDHLYRNNGDGTFTDTIEQHMPHTTWFSMGADVGDMNNDGLLDFVIADMSSSTHFGQKTTMGAMGKNAWFLEHTHPPQYMRNALYLNTGTDRFMEIGYLSGVDSSDWTWSVKFSDLDNDGFLDLFVTNGMSRNWNDSDQPFTIGHLLGKTKWDLYEHLPTMPQRNLAYRNSGDLQFDDVSESWGLNHNGMSFAAAMSDLDRDGDLDLVVANLDEPVSIYRNESTAGHRVLIRLEGTQSNVQGVGAKVRITTADGPQVRQVIPVCGFLASHEPIAHFGLGRQAVIDQLSIIWPTGHEQVFRKLPADRIYTISESADANRATHQPTATDAPRPLFRPRELPSEAQHFETHFDDFQRQPLLPNKLSQLGPGVAVGDVDADGDDDFFLAGAAGQTGMLFVNNGKGEFRRSGTYPFILDAECEDMAPLFFDADGDGDLDLFVSSGGVECDPGEKVLQDRLYYNNGRGNYLKADPVVLPPMYESTGASAACDFDRDGDLDLFVGGRVTPGAYPLAPRSFLLKNSNGRFEDATDSIAPTLRQPGMVTSAIWSDVDDDGWLDLMLTLEWGSLKFFRNVEGKLIDRTNDVGLHRWRGWWNGIAGRDLDGDGDIDFVATNFGLNTKYHATPQKPAKLFYGDFDKTGTMHVVEAEYENDIVFPIRGRSCSSHAMPFVREKFSSYKDFALATLDEIYSAECLSQSLQFSATTLESGAFLNQGELGFSFKPLPQLAQAAPGFGLVLSEIDGDGVPDLYLVQNFFSPQVETGRMDGGVSLFLRGVGDGSFRPIWPWQSGLVVSGDAKGLSLIDLNRDRGQDMLVGINDGKVKAFENQVAASDGLLSVRLLGPSGNPTGVGSRVSLLSELGTMQTSEVYAGGGYLSQSTPVLTFGRGTKSTASTVEVVWPDGSKSRHSVPANQKQVDIKHSDSADTLAP